MLLLTLRKGAALRHGARVLVVVVAALVALAWGASLMVQRTTREWFESDLRQRAQIAVSGARAALLAHWSRAEATSLRVVLDEIAHDERIQGVAACPVVGEALAATNGYPAGWSCAELAYLAEDDVRGPWSLVRDAGPGPKVLLSAVPLLGREEGSLGFVVLVQDLAELRRREATARWFLLAAFLIFVLAAGAATLVAVRVAWRGLGRELRSAVQGATQPRPEFQPLMRDVRELVERVAAERELEAGQGTGWTPMRLKQTLSRTLPGERVVLVANREPYIHERRADGGLSVLHPASGLVTALEPVLRACSGVWVAHGSGSADRDVVDRRDRVAVPPGDESYHLRRVWLSSAQERGYYAGFANEGLWPLSHIAHTRPHFRREDWQHYCDVNRMFADAVCDEVEGDDPVVLVQDYHFALLPRYLRERLPRATIITFWHIPWPNAERFGICPYRHELLDGLLGSSIVGFHTQLFCNNFVESIDRYCESRIDREQQAVVQQGRPTLVRPYPISIEWPSRWAEEAPPPEDCRRQVLAELGLPSDALLGVGVDRMDYTKGIEERLAAVERLLERFPSLRHRFTFVQLAAPSRTVIETYRALNDRVEATAARINERFGRDGSPPVRLLRAHHEPPDVFRYYRAADLCYVSSLHDGMNLVAKEFVAARADERGVLVLSQFTGAARELGEALIVNPYDIEEASSALSRAVTMAPDEQRDRMRAMRAYLAEFNVYRWAGRMLVDAARLRRRDQVSVRLSATGPMVIERAS